MRFKRDQQKQKTEIMKMKRLIFFSRKHLPRANISTNRWIHTYTQSLMHFEWFDFFSAQQTLFTILFSVTRERKSSTTTMITRSYIAAQ